jgi:OOP family OmpA-OmpF porin
VSPFRPRNALLVSSLTLLVAANPVVTWAAEDSAETEDSKDDSKSYSVYLEYVGGLSLVDDQDVDGADASGAGLSGSADLSVGYVVGAAIGVKFLEHYRGELQITYNDSDVDNLSVQGEPATASGGLSMLAIMANGYVDWDFGFGVLPYVGAGIGYGEADFSARNRSGPTQTEIDDTDSVFVWNLMLGATVPVGESLELSLGYRYLASEDLRLSGRAAGEPRRFDSEFDAHQFIAGLRMNF